MKNAASSTIRSRSGRGCPRAGKLDCLDGAIVGDATRADTESTATPTDDTKYKRHDSREQLVTRPAGWSVHTRARRVVHDLEGALLELAHATPSGEHSMWPSGPNESGADRSLSQGHSRAWPRRIIEPVEIRVRETPRAFQALQLVPPIPRKASFGSASPGSRELRSSARGVRGQAVAWKAPWPPDGRTFPHHRLPPDAPRLPTRPLRVLWKPRPGYLTPRCS